MHRLALSILVTGCLAASSLAQESKERVFRATIHRDAFGVAHVHGATDADAAYGLAYAQAEDNLWQVEENFVRAIGRAAELYGQPLLLDDWINHSLEIPRLSREEFDESDKRLQALLRGFAAGFNDYRKDHPKVPLRVLKRVEPWYPLALIRYLYYQRGFLGSLGLPRASYAAAFRRITGLDIKVATADDAIPRDEVGSNSWAVTPAKSASGEALLFINPHLPFFGPSQVYEGHVLSDEGWNFTGYGRFGFPMPYVGFNEHLGWASTDNAADLADAYVETFDDAAHPLSYRYGEERRDARRWTAKVGMLADGEIKELELELRRTHHGPLVATSGRGLVAAKMAKFETPGWLAQWYAMTRATSLDEFRRAVEPLDMLFGNYLYADCDGNIFYVYNACVPKRDERFDWSAPVDGSDPRTEWLGFHPMGDLPQLLNPESGYLQNCNSTPFLSTSAGNPARGDFPSYMAPEPDSVRARNARRILESREKFSFDEWRNLSYDTTLIRAATDLPPLMREFDAFGTADPERAAELARAIELLREWDHVATTESTATTLYVLFAEKTRSAGQRAYWPLTTALRAACDELALNWDTIEVAWGELNRHQRLHSSGDANGRDDAPSHPVAGGPSWAGPMFTFWSAPEPGQKRRYGRGGNSYVAVVRFGERVEGFSLHPFGSATSPYAAGRDDLQVRYLTGDYKPAWLTLDEVRENATEVTTVATDG